MYATYKDQDYYYLEDDFTGKVNIGTNQKNKADDTFNLTGGMYYKEISNAQLKNIFDIDYYVKYEYSDKLSQRWWKIDPYGTKVISNGAICLTFYDGLLDGWEIQDKSTCSAKVALSQIEKCKISYLYLRRDNNTFQQPITIEKEVSLDELIHTREKYFLNNI